MNLTFIIETFISSILVGLFFTYCGAQLFQKKLCFDIKTITIVFLLIMFITLNFLFLDNILKSSLSYLVVLVVYKFFFDKSILKCALASFASYMTIAMGEIIFIIIISVLGTIGIVENISNLTGSIIANVLIVFFASLMSILIRKPVIKLLSKTKDYTRITLIITFSLLMASFCSLFYKAYFRGCEFDIYFVFNSILVLTLAYIAYVVVKQYYDKIKISDEYGKYVEYSKQSEKLVDQYSISQHENKNELIIIRSMVHKNNKKLLEYLDEIITSKDNIEDAWIRHLRYLPFGGLKGIIHNKIREMQDNEISVFLNISRTVGSSRLKELTIKENVQLSKIYSLIMPMKQQYCLKKKRFILTRTLNLIV